MGVSVLSVSRVLPGDEAPGSVLTNQAVSQLMDQVRRLLGRDFPISTPEFPEERIGIRSRRVLDASWTSRDMAVEAARRALAGHDGRRVRLILVATVTPDRVVPNIAATVQDRLGLPQEVTAFDISLGCNGFLTALEVATRMLETHDPGSLALVVGSDAMLRVLDASDRSTCVIFGDGAGALLLGRARRGGFVAFDTLTIGERGPLIEIRADAGDEPVFRFVSRSGRLAVEPDKRSRLRVSMDGRAVYKDMVRILPERISEYFARRDLCLEEIDCFLCHQANARMVEAIVERMGIEPERVPSSIHYTGNTTSASIPILFHQALQSGQLSRGQKVLLAAFGTGYSMGITVLDWR